MPVEMQSEGTGESRSLAAFSSEPHLTFGPAAVWYTSPPGAVVQVLEPARGTVELSNWMVGVAFEELERRFPRRKGLLFVFDLALLTGRSHAARSVFLGRAREVSARFSEAWFVPPRTASAAQRHSTRASLMLLRALGVKIELAESAAAAVRARGMSPMP